MRSQPVEIVLARLKLRLLLNRVGRNRGGKVNAAAGASVGLIVGVLAMTGLAEVGRHASPAGARAMVVVGFNLLLLAWAVFPLVSFGVDETLDPSRLAPFPLRRRQQIVGLLLASLVGIAPAAVVLGLAGVVAGYGRGPATAVVALAVVEEILLCVAAARALATALSGALSTRRGRDVAVTLSFLLGLGFAALRIFAARVTEVTDAALERASDIARWTPMGLLGESVLWARDGRAGLALAGTVLVLPVLALVVWGWAVALDRSMTSAVIGGTVGRRAGPVGSRGALLRGPLRRLPPRPWAAVAARELRYVSRDPRRRAGMFGLLTFGLFIPVLLAFSGGQRSPSSVLLASVAGYMAVLGTMNQFGFDGGALWFDIVAGNLVRDELIGKNAAVAVQVVPIVALAGTVLAAMTGGWLLIAPALVLALAGLGVGLGVANVVSVRYPLPMAEGRNAFAGPGAGQGCATSAVLFLCMLVQGLLMAPVAIAAVITLATTPAALAAVAPLCAVYGWLMWRAGLAVAARWGWWRQPELLAAVDPRRSA